MQWIYLIIAVFAGLSIYFTYEEYCKEKQIKSAFIIVCILQGIVILALIGLFFWQSIAAMN